MNTNQTCPCGYAEKLYAEWEQAYVYYMKKGLYKPQDEAHEASETELTAWNALCTFVQTKGLVDSVYDPYSEENARRTEALV